MLIRTFKAEDTQAILDLMRSQKRFSKEAPVALEQKLSQNYTRVIENDNGDIIGYGSICQKGRIEDLCVHSDYKKQGLGTVLLIELESYARHRGIPKITVKCAASSQKLFLRLDFRPIKTHVPDKSVNMEKVLFSSVV